MLNVNLIYSEVPKMVWLTNWSVFCLYIPPTKTLVRIQNLPHKYFAPNFLQTFYECAFLFGTKTDQTDRFFCPI